MKSQIQEIRRLFDVWGQDCYSEAVSQIAHAEQCASLARSAGADDNLVIASLLHDIGHLLVLDANSGRACLDTDDEHEATGARYVAQLFGPKVAGPIALHVAAKRYLCAVEKSYFSTLSPASVASLELQGGPMNEAEVIRFERLPQVDQAVALRRWDDEAKIAGREVAALESYIEMMESIAASV